MAGKKALKKQVEHLEKMLERRNDALASITLDYAKLESAHVAVMADQEIKSAARVELLLHAGFVDVTWLRSMMGNNGVTVNLDKTVFDRPAITTLHLTMLRPDQNVDLLVDVLRDGVL